jgi:hypothetical protein
MSKLHQSGQEMHHCIFSTDRNLITSKTLNIAHCHASAAQKVSMPQALLQSTRALKQNITGNKEGKQER